MKSLIDFIICATWLIIRSAECIGYSIKTLQRVALVVEVLFSINGNLYVFYIRRSKCCINVKTAQQYISHWYRIRDIFYILYED